MPEDQARKVSRRSFWGSFQRPEGRQFFLEVFAGQAVLTQAVSKAGISTLPPVEIEANEFVREEVDITDPKVVQHIKLLIEEGYMPCSTSILVHRAHLSAKLAKMMGVPPRLDQLHISQACQG